MLGFECRRAVVQEPRARHSAMQRHSSSSGKAHLPAPLVLAARSRRRRSAHRKEDLEEAVLHVQNQSAKSGGRARHICWCRELSCWVCQQATADSQMNPRQSAWSTRWRWWRALLKPATRIRSSLKARCAISAIWPRLPCASRLRPYSLRSQCRSSTPRACTGRERQV